MTDIWSGYVVEPAENGGFVVLNRPADADARRILGAFTTSGDLLEWLVDQHAGFEKSRVAYREPV